MALSKYSFIKAVNTDRLTKEIQTSPAITVALDHITTTGTALDVWFKAELGIAEEGTLTTLVTAHINTPLEVVLEPAKVIIYEDKPFKDAKGYRARFIGMSGVALKGVTTNIDFKITEERYINGMNLILKGQTFGDKVNFEIVDVDNIIGYGAGVVLDRFGQDWYMASDKNSQDPVLAEYPARIIAGLYLRIAYTSVGTVDDVQVKANLRLHKKTV